MDTFRPVKTEEIEEHAIHTEAFDVPAEAAQAINEAKASGGRVLAVGTTAARALETAADGEDGVRASSGRTGLFIYPGYRFRAVDMLLTNFHLPKSTLLMLVCAFAGRERVLSAYEQAIREGYRFYSFGDAMLIL